MKHQKLILPMLRNGKLKFKTPVNFEVKYFLNKETEDVLTDHQQYYPFYTTHQAWMTYYWIGHSNDFRTTQSNDYEGATIAEPLLSPCITLWGACFGIDQAEVRHLSHALILLIMGLFEVLIANMMLICGAKNIKINIT